MPLKHNKATATMFKIDPHRGILIVQFELVEGKQYAFELFVKSEKSNELIDKARKFSINKAKEENCQLGVFKVATPPYKIYLSELGRFLSQKSKLKLLSDVVEECKKTCTPCLIWIERTLIGEYNPEIGFVEDQSFAQNWS